MKMLVALRPRNLWLVTRTLLSTSKEKIKEALHLINRFALAAPPLDTAQTE